MLRTILLNGTAQLFLPVIIWKLNYTPKFNSNKNFLRKMPTTKKRIEIVSETVTLFVLKNSGRRDRQNWCKQCAAEVFWIARAEINLFGISELPQGAFHTNGDRICPVH